MPDPFRSQRLIYRAVEPEDADFFLQIQADHLAYANSTAGIHRPQAKKDGQAFLKSVEESLLGVVICLPAPVKAQAYVASESNSGNDNLSKPIPIGAIHLSKEKEHLRHHRWTDIGVDIVRPYQGQGYGSEAINWALDWAFDTAGLHRVGIQAFEWNEGARRLYERLGFKQEGITREMLWYQGRWWDEYAFGMLEREWRQRKELK